MSGEKSNYPYITPDRSNRPASEDDPNVGSSRELGPSRLISLADGRLAVVELAAVDGFTIGYCFFDIAGLEDASVDDLAALLQRSGMDCRRRDLEAEAPVLAADKTDDAQGRAIWKFTVTYLPDW